MEKIFQAFWNFAGHLLAAATGDIYKMTLIFPPTASFTYVRLMATINYFICTGIYLFYLYGVIGVCISKNLQLTSAPLNLK